MAATQQGVVQIYNGESVGTFIFYSDNTTVMIANYNTYNPSQESYSIGPGALSRREITGEDGEVEAVRVTGKFIECTVQLRPQAAAVANALISATLPEIGYTCEVSGMKVIQVGGFADAWNVAQGANNMWHVVDASPLSGGAQDPAMWSVTMRRYAGITGNTVTPD